MANPVPKSRGRKPAAKPGQIVTTAQLSEIYGVSVKTIHNWREAGMPLHRKVSERKYEFDTAAVYRWRLEREQTELQKIHQQELREVQSNTGTTSPMTPGEPVMSAVEARTRKEIAQALMAELELATKQEQVANIDDLMANFTDALVEVRAKLVSQSSRLAGILSYQDEEAIREILDKDAADTLEALSDYNHKYRGDGDG